jgi:diguanylate cyclase (GGDEF)-like protein
MGGEEFLVVAPMDACTNPLPLFQRLRNRIASHAFGTRGGQLRVTASIGVACAREMQPENLLATADRALYQAKDQGRNRVALADTCPCASPPRSIWSKPK